MYTYIHYVRYNDCMLQCLSRYFDNRRMTTDLDKNRNTTISWIKRTIVARFNFQIFSTTTRLHFLNNFLTN